MGLLFFNFYTISPNCSYVQSQPTFEVDSLDLIWLPGLRWLETRVFRKGAVKRYSNLCQKHLARSAAFFGIFSGFPWFLLTFPWFYPFFLGIFSGFSWFSQVFHGFLRFFMGFTNLSMGFSHPSVSSPSRKCWTKPWRRGRPRCCDGWVPPRRWGKVGRKAMDHWELMINDDG